MNIDLLSDDIVNYSHAYLLKVSNYSDGLDFAKKLAFKIISREIKNANLEDIEYQINNETYQDLLIVDSDTSIKSNDLSNIVSFMENKSLIGSPRIYIIVGVEKVTGKMINKLLKFVEEPPEGVNAIMLTLNPERVLNTIRSRCQEYSITTEITYNEELLNKSINFMNDLAFYRKKMLCHYKDYIEYFTGDDGKKDLKDFFSYIELLLNNAMHKIFNINFDEKIGIIGYDKVDVSKLSKLLEITDKMIYLINRNGNTQLLFDRYIIEMSKEMK